MTSARELADKIESDRQLTEDLSAPIAGIKDELEGIAAQARALGVERVAGVLEQAKGILEEAESGRVVLQGGLEKARWQVMSAVHGNLGPGAKGSGPGGSFVAADGKVTTADGNSAIPHLDAVPPHLRQDPSPTGEELTGVDRSIGPFQKEHEGANADRKLNPFQRGTTSALRNIGDLKDAADQLAKPTMVEMGDLWKPPETYPVVGTAEPVSTYTAIPQAPADYQSAVGNLVVVAALVAEWAARGLKHRKGKS